LLGDLSIAQNHLCDTPHHCHKYPITNVGYLLYKYNKTPNNAHQKWNGFPNQQKLSVPPRKIRQAKTQRDGQKVRNAGHDNHNEKRQPKIIQIIPIQNADEHQNP
jgi:hypothetical protein